MSLPLPPPSAAAHTRLVYGGRAVSISWSLWLQRRNIYLQEEVWPQRLNLSRHRPGSDHMMHSRLIQRRASSQAATDGAFRMLRCTAWRQQNILENMTCSRSAPANKRLHRAVVISNVSHCHLDNFSWRLNTLFKWLFWINHRFEHETREKHP